ncbi:nitrile hydratase subunit beta [Burkholderia gladioli]|uniref:nitrile hydratase subunit beta n=1 Tax=Burkholderia gladioli TaxID=28095 RepID=UPI00155F7630|nr:nitrile hydratase subunit beta [Burkholderia gladioli]NRF84161.1 nitrile hydratase subunit beta [Burkholderia gladioli]
MKLQHHLGGLANLGAVNLDTRVFAQPWERRIFGIHTVMMAESAHLADALPRYPLADLPTAFRDTWTWASLRTGAEAMQPFEYFKYRYYEKWLMGISQFFIDRGYLSADELAERTAAYRTAPEAALPSTPAPVLNEQIRAYLRQGDSGRQPRANAARFVAGDAVRVADPEAVDHTRLPGYLRNRAGIVDHVYPDAWSYFVDTGADGIGAPMPVYRIVFRGEDVWGPRQGEPNTRLYADLYEAYLVAAN